MNKILESSMFKAVFRNDILMVKFTKWQNVYVYIWVSNEDIVWMSNSESKWRFLHLNIKPKYKFVKTKFETLEDCFDKYVVWL